MEYIESIKLMDEGSKILGRIAFNVRENKEKNLF